MKRKNLVLIVAGTMGLGLGGCYLLRGESSPLRKWIVENYAPWAKYPGIDWGLFPNTEKEGHLSTTRNYKN